MKFEKEKKGFLLLTATARMYERRKHCESRESEDLKEGVQRSREEDE